jgi:hypothetical protein
VLILILNILYDLTCLMKNNLHVFLGATVADAAARPLHWVYDQKKLLTYIKDKKDFTFQKKKQKSILQHQNWESLRL